MALCYTLDISAQILTRYTNSMRIVGKHNRSEIELDPVVAFRRGRQLDRALSGAYPKRTQGVSRGTHAEFQRLDEARIIEIAKRLNGQFSR